MKKLADLESQLERAQIALTGKSADLTTRQVRAFLMVAKASIEGDPLTTEDLRRFLNLSSGTAHNTVAYFVEHGFIERRAAPMDGRAKHLQLTDAGRTIAEFLAGGGANAAFADAFVKRPKEETPMKLELVSD